MDIPIDDKKSSINKRRVLRAGAFCMLLIALIAAFTQLQPALPSIDESELWISEVQHGNFTRQVRGVGVLAPSEIRWIAANTAGRVERVLVKPGAVVTQGTVIAQLSNPLLIGELQRARWELDAAQANLLALKAQLQEQSLEQKLLITQAKMDLQAAQLKEQAEKPLAKQHIISDLEFAKTELNTKQSQAILDIRLETQQHRTQLTSAKLAAEQAQVRKFSNMLEHFEEQIEALTITADIAGVLQQISVDVGQRVEIGSNIARIARPDSLLAELQVQENLVQDLQLGLPVSVDTRNGIVAGKVARIDPRVINGNVQIDVELIEQLPSGARPDLSVIGTIVVEQISDALYIDRPNGASAQSDVQLFKLDASEQYASLENIHLGKASVSSIQVLSGLKRGDQVVVSDMGEYQQHSQIKIIQ
ncbi:efflux RND transporter periplasmic adaptor subunit [Ningiella sp. W23]|uniref:efflux RND transporter periplasmic adaptor subunit n=1 Tax=Ningiella sp. W23 TaxID=3023715 RepID=UPI0037565EFE